MYTRRDCPEELPYLQELELAYVCIIEAYDPSQTLLPELLLRSKCNLKKLSIRFIHRRFGFEDTDTYIQDPHISSTSLSLPQVTPHLEYLSIQSDGSTPIFDMLLSTREDGHLDIAWPRIKQLKMEIRPMSYDLVENIVTTFSRRDVDMRREPTLTSVSHGDNNRNGPVEKPDTKIILSGVHEGILASDLDHVQFFRQHGTLFLTSWDDDFEPQTV